MRFIAEENGDEWHIGEDSRVFVPKKGDSIAKHYRTGRFSLEDIRRYILLHRMLANKGLFQIEYDEASRDMHGLQSDKIGVSFLDIGEDISWDNWGIVHKVAKVKGDSLLGSHHSSFERKIKHGRLFGRYLEREIAEIVTNELGIKKELELQFGLGVPHIVGGNIKVTSHTKEGIELCVTDIGADIRKLLDQNKEAIDRLLSE